MFALLSAVIHKGIRVGRLDGLVEIKLHYIMDIGPLTLYVSTRNNSTGVGSRSSALLRRCRRRLQIHEQQRRLGLRLALDLHRVVVRHHRLQSILA